MKTIFSAALLLVICSTVISSRAQPEWYLRLQKVEVLKTKRETVVDIFGTPKDSSPARKRFETKDGILIVTFSTGKCSTQKTIGYDVEEGVVEKLSFWVDKSKRVKIDQLGFDLDGFEKSEIDDVPGAFVYEDFDVGVSIALDRRGLVESLGIEPSSKYDHLMCARRN